MLKIKVDTSGIRKSFKKAVQIAENEIDWESIGIMAKLSIDQNFAQGGRYQDDKDNPIGGDKKWVPRKESELNPILDDEGSLRASIYSKSDSKSAKVGSSGLKYNAAQNYGYPQGGIPARPFLIIHPDDINKITAQISDAIVKAFE